MVNTDVQPTIGMLIENALELLDRIDQADVSLLTRDHLKGLAEVRRRAGSIAVAKRPQVPTKRVVWSPEGYKQAKGAEAYELRCQGLEWEPVALKTGVTRKSGRSTFLVSRWAREHAERNGLPWPIKVRRRR